MDMRASAARGVVLNARVEVERRGTAVRRVRENIVAIYGVDRRSRIVGVDIRGS